MNPLKRLAKESAIYGLSSIVGRFLNYLLVPLYTRIFLPQEYGIVTELYAYASFLMILLTFGMETTFFRFSEGREDRGTVYSTAFLPVLFLNLAFMALGVAASSSIAETLNYRGHPEYLVYFVLIVGLDAIAAIPFARLRQQHRALRFAGLKLANIFVTIALNLFFLLVCPYLLSRGFEPVRLVYDPAGGVGYVFLANLLASAVTLLLLCRDLFGVRLHFDRDLFGEMGRYTLPLLFAGLAGMANETLDRILLRHLLVVPEGVVSAADYVMSQIGIYGANYKVAVLMTLFIQTFRYAAEPFFFSRAKDRDAAELYRRVMTYFVLFGLAIFLGVMLYIDLVQRFIGAKYHSGIGIVPILLLANLFLGVIFNLSIWYKLSNKTRYGAYLTFCGAAITVVANLVLIPLMGYWGAAWATLICYFCTMVLSYLWGQKHYPVRYEVGKLTGYLAFALGLYALSRSWPFGGEGAVLAANTFLLLLFLGVAGYREREGIRPAR